MTGKASKMTKPKAAADMSQREILEALAGTGDTARRSGKNREVPEGDPRTWKFGRMTIELLQAYENFIPRENVPTDDEEHYCSCSGADDGRPMIECSNGNHCLFNWFHLECIGMAQHEIPGDNEDWFCQDCKTYKIGRLRKRSPKSNPQQGRPDAKRVKNDKEQKPTLTISTALTQPPSISKPSPGTPKPWTADVDKSFVEDPEVLSTFNLTSLSSVKKSLRRPANYLITNNDSDVEMSDYAKPVQKKSKGSWSEEEKEKLIQSAKECHELGLRGDPFWDCVKPKLAARGVPRGLGGVKSMWLRYLREETKIDERRKQNANNLRTAIQKSTKEKAAEKAKQDENEIMENADSEAETEHDDEGMEDVGFGSGMKNGDSDAETEYDAETMEGIGFGFDPEITMVPRVQRFQRGRTTSL